MENGKKVHALPSRNEVPDELTWRLEDIFPSDDDWNKEYEAVKEKLSGAASYQGKLGESAEQLYHALKFQDEVTERFGKLYTYAHMRYDQDTTNAFYQGMDSKAKSLAAQVGSAFAFVVPEILSIEEAKLNNSWKLMCRFSCTGMHWKKLMKCARIFYLRKKKHCSHRFRKC